MAHWQAPDLDEVRPDRFVINNDKVRPWLKGEGVTVGRFFELGTWRRAGLIARLRERGFNVRTLADRIAALPALRSVPAPGAEGVRLLAPRERFAVFDAATLHWRELAASEHQGRPAVRLPADIAVRRRKSRGHADYYLTARTATGAINLLPVSETDALLHAYSQIAGQHGLRALHATQQGDLVLVPQRQAILPPPHRDLLDRLAVEDAERWSFAPPVLAQVAAVLERLGLRLVTDA
ncbi:hypothetical protein [Kallotenue papyrolyticum]|uniref:hypothetical protein n=1 Tax=Kallotenue papyrolyticum TaxID=1325125 RepID=UPI0004785C55|nr:hypothetical protein [Kallotenue papyrolyticum]